MFTPPWNLLVLLSLEEEFQESVLPVLHWEEVGSLADRVYRTEPQAGYHTGYSWLSNERGLTIDNVLAFDLVLPEGTFTTVTKDSNPDLFWALKVRIRLQLKLL